MVTRRLFLKSSGLAMFGFGASPLWLERAVAAPNPDRKKVLVAIFQRGAERLRTALDGDLIDRGRALIIELGKESLNDHGDWVILHRERPIELPEGGA